MKTNTFGSILNVPLRMFLGVATFVLLVVPSLTFAATITVNSNGDARVPGDGSCDLMEAIDNSNQDADNSGGDCVGGSGVDDINFNIGAGDAQVITLASSAVDIISAVNIDGTTQPGVTPASCSPRNLYISVDGGGNTQKIFYFLAGSENSTVKGLNLYGTTVAAVDIATDNITVTCNNIGTDLAGMAVAPNVNQDNGIRFETATLSHIGGVGEVDRNLISGNTNSGLSMFDSTGNFISGNYVGTDVTGTVAIPNGGIGIDLFNSDNNLIGGSIAGEGNLVSGNNSIGVNINSSDLNTIKGNYIGVNAAGTSEIHNAYDGINVFDSVNTVIGGAALPTERNVISGNNGQGINLNTANNTTIQGNYIGLDFSGSLIIPNQYNGINLFQSNSCTIGGANLGEGNVVAGATSGSGINLNISDLNVVKGNLLGVDATGTVAFGNAYDGISIFTANSNTIGGSLPGERNIISGNLGNGINIGDGDLNMIQGNYIGTDITGTLALANTYSGVNIGGGVGTRDLNVIGGNRLSGEGNVISGNSQSGVSLYATTNTTIRGNLVGLTADGLSGLGNANNGLNANQSNDMLVGGAVAGEGNVFSANLQAGMGISESSNVTVFGNYIGTDVNGTNDLGNTQDGIQANQVTLSNIGGPNAGERNIIAGNGNGPFSSSAIILAGDSTDNFIRGNYLGLDVAGNPLGNDGFGVNLGGQNNTVGGSAAGEGNVMSANGTGGIVLVQTGALPTADNIVRGNLIGTDSTGAVVAGYGNGLIAGIITAFGSEDNMIGGTGPGDANIIAGNDNFGVYVFQINTFGPPAPVRNSILGNSIHDNGSLGIEHALDLDGDLVADEHIGVDANDHLDSDVGPNDYLNHPIIYNIAPLGGGVVQVDYFLDVPSDDYRVEFFSNTAGDASNHGEGETFLDFDSITHTGGGVQFFSKTLTAAPGDFITATVTEDLGAGVYGSTSEFSPTTVVADSGIDFGDAPDTAIGTSTGNYNTLVTDQGAYHVIDGHLYLGSCVDSDQGDLQNAIAQADDASNTTPVSGVCAGGADDENGVSFTSNITRGENVTVNVTSSEGGILNVWIDFNQDGDFDDLDEQIFTDTGVVAGVNSLSFTASSNLVEGASFARFRLSSILGITPYDEVVGGEVEDYEVSLVGASSGGGSGTQSAGGRRNTTPAPVALHGSSPEIQPPKPALDCAERYENPFPFNDTLNHWARIYIEFLYRHCVIDGKSSGFFAPEDRITRAEVAKIVMKLFDWGTSDFVSVFSDVYEGDWFSEYVIQGYRTGTIVGYMGADSKPEFRPNQPITRAEALKILLYVKGVEIGGETVSYTDVSRSDWFYDYVAYATDHGIIEGYKNPQGGANFFAPNKPVTRAEFSKMAVMTFEPDFDELHAVAQVLGASTVKTHDSSLQMFAIGLLIIALGSVGIALTREK